MHYQARDFVLAEGFIVSKAEKSSERDFRISIELPVYQNWKPGQFVMLRWGHHIIGRPFAIVNWQKISNEKSILELWIRRLGAATEELFNIAHSNMKVWATLPLGNALPELGRCLFISGGVGAASILPLNNENSHWLHGERNKESLDKHLQQFTNLQVIFEQGSQENGYVTELLKKIELNKFDSAVVCGPTPLLEAAAKIFNQREFKKPVYLGLEEKMACGIGLCFSCSVKCKTDMKRCCLEGPWFEAQSIPEHFDFRRGLK